MKDNPAKIISFKVTISKKHKNLLDERPETYNTSSERTTWAQIKSHVRSNGLKKG